MSDAKREAAKRRGSVPALPGLLCAVCLVGATASSADVVWEVADEGPRAPEAVEILGDDARTLAFGAAGDWELRGTTWHPVPLLTTDVVGRERTLFFANGRFGATTFSIETCLMQLFVLRDDTWTRLWTGNPASCSFARKRGSISCRRASASASALMEPGTRRKSGAFVPSRSRTEQFGTNCLSRRAAGPCSSFRESST